MSQPPQQNWQPMPYGQPSPYWQPENGYYTRRRSRLPSLLTIGGVLAVAVTVTLVLVLNGGADTSTARGVAEGVVDAFNDNDFNELVELSCTDYKDEMERSVRQANSYAGGTDRIEVTAVLDDIFMDGDDAAVAHVKITLTHVPDDLADVLDEGETNTVNVGIREKNGDWCIDRFA